METWRSFYDQLLQTSIAEFVAVACGVLSVWYSKQERILVYPFGILSVAIFIYLTYTHGLYAETGINAYYLIMSVYGWWNWQNSKGSQSTQLLISKSTAKGNVFNLLTFLLATLLVYVILLKFTDSTVPLIDAITTGLAITGMYLLALKKVEHWLFWIACDLVSIPLYIYKGLPFTSLQFLVFTLLAVIGWISWNRKLNEYTY